ncbi:MAG: hypothetical protein EU535_08960, partial [Promethearchaeota archaeon]
MPQRNTIHLTFVPFEYWKNPLSEFKIVQSDKALPEGSSFFLVWHDELKEEPDLVKVIEHNFPSIPANKLLTCNINLAFPNGNTQTFSVAPIMGKLMPIGPALNVLFNIDISQSKDRFSPFNRYSSSIKTYIFIIKLIFELLYRGCFIPTILQKEQNIYDGKWKLILKTPLDHNRFTTIISNCPWHSHNLPINFIQTDKNSYETDGLWHPSFIFSNFMDKVGDYLIREEIKKAKFRTFEDFYRPEFQKEKSRDEALKWDYKFIKSLLEVDYDYQIAEFYESIIPSVIQNWVQTAQAITFNKGFTISLELRFPDTSEGEWTLALWILIQDSGKKIPIKKFMDSTSPEKKKVLTFFEDEAKFIEYLLRALGTAANIFSPIKKNLAGAIPNRISLQTSEVMQFLKYPRYLLVQSGFNVDLPDVFNQGGKQRLSARLVIKKGKASSKASSSGLPSLFELNSLISFKWEATLEGKSLSEEDFLALIKSENSLVNIGNDWVLLDQQDLDDLKTVFDEGSEHSSLMRPSGEISYMEALKLGLSKNLQLREGGTKYEVIIEGDLEEIINRIQFIDSFEEIPVPKTFNGTLRPYQQTALTWMSNMCSFNFGVCLADDMGLGKTIQVIAYLLHRKNTYP